MLIWPGFKSWMENVRRKVDTQGTGIFFGGAGTVKLMVLYQKDLISGQAERVTIDAVFQLSL